MKNSFPAWKFKGATSLTQEGSCWSRFAHLSFQLFNVEKSCHQQNKASIAQWPPHHRAALGLFWDLINKKSEPKFLETPPGQSILVVSLSM